jgi:hypothetical protein
MKIREGAHYRTRDGDVVGPMRLRKDQSWYSSYHQWNEDGGIFSSGAAHGLDLISEVYVSDTPPADAPAPETIRLDPRTEWKFFRQMGPHELVTNASAPMLETKTLRDEFAGYAIIGLLAAGDCHAFNRDEMAVEAYRQADAMMEARKK